MEKIARKRYLLDTIWPFHSWTHCSYGDLHKSKKQDVSIPVGSTKTRTQRLKNKEDMHLKWGCVWQWEQNWRCIWSRYIMLCFIKHDMRPGEGALAGPGWGLSLRYQPYDRTSVKGSLFGTWKGGLEKGVEAEKGRGQRRTKTEKEEKRPAEDTREERK